MAEGGGDIIHMEVIPDLLAVRHRCRFPRQQGKDERADQPPRMLVRSVQVEDAAPGRPHASISRDLLDALRCLQLAATIQAVGGLVLPFTTKALRPIVFSATSRPHGSLTAGLGEPLPKSRGGVRPSRI